MHLNNVLMNDIMSLSVILVLALLALFFCLIWFLITHRNKLTKLEFTLNELTILFQNIQQISESNRSRIEEIEHQQIKQKKYNQDNKNDLLFNLDDINQQLSRIKNNVETLSTQQPEDKLYSRAFKLAELGADVDEISKTCEIPLAEAEMLLAVHQNKVGNT